MTTLKLPLTLKSALCTSVMAFALSGTAQASDTAATTELPVVKAGFVEDSGGSQRINLSGKLRMLSQRIPAAACNVSAGIAPDESKAILDGALAEFDTIVQALAFGNDDLGVYGAETRLRTNRVIEELQAKFAPLQAVLDNAPNSIPDQAGIQTMADGNMEVLEMAKLLVVELSAQYASRAELLQSDVMAIDIAGRQRMLTQKVSKELCLIMSDINAASSQETVVGTIDTFEVSLSALRNGMPEIGMPPARDGEIADGLDNVKALWTEIKPQITRAAAGEALTNEERGVLFVGLNTTMAEMNRVVGLYSDASKLGL